MREGGERETKRERVRERGREERDGEKERVRERGRKRDKEREREGGRERELLDTNVTPAAQGHLRTNHTFTVIPQKAETQCIKDSKKTAHSSSIFDTKNQ